VNYSYRPREDDECAKAIPGRLLALNSFAGNTFHFSATASPINSDGGLKPQDENSFNDSQSEERFQELHPPLGNSPG